VTEVLLLLFLLPLLLALGVQQLLGAVFRRYRTVRNHALATGAAVARSLLDAYGLQRVRLEVTPGVLTDHYDGERQTLRLSQVVANEPSVAALGIAAHEVSHAYQDAAGSRVYRLRQAVGEPLAALAPWSGLFLIGGFWFGIPVLIALSLLYAAGLVLFALATLPVELGASHHALGLLRSTGLADERDVHGVRRVLSAAALTYAVGLLDRLGFFFVLVFVSELTRSVMT
jgi:Zn-dependent membrane protease YugP